MRDKATNLNVSVPWFNPLNIRDGCRRLEGIEGIRIELREREGEQGGKD
jgi:hypothetical protein